MHVRPRACAQRGSRARDPVADGLSLATRGGLNGSRTTGRIVVGARACNRQGSAFPCRHGALTVESSSNRGVRGIDKSLLGMRKELPTAVCRARPSEPRAGTVTSLSVRTLIGGDVGTTPNVPIIVRKGHRRHRARMSGLTIAADEFFPQIRPI